MSQAVEIDTGARRRYTQEMREGFIGSFVLHLVTFIAMLVVVMIAGNSSAAEWKRGSKDVESVTPWGGANYIPDADTTSPSIHTGQCGAIYVQCWGTNLSSLIQTCNDRYEYDVALDTTECDDLNLTALTCGSTPTGVQVDPAPEWIRMKAGTNFGSSQFFRVFCSGSR